MRLFRMVATPVLLLSLLALLIWGASWGWRNLTAPLPSPSPTPCVTKSASIITSDMVSVRVLNGGFTSGLAGRVAEHLGNNGFTVLRTGNTEERVKETIVRGSTESEAKLTMLQSHFKGAIIEHDDRVDGSVDVLVGTGYEGVTGNGVTQIEAPGGVTCDYPSPSPTPSSPAPSASPTS